MKYNNTIQILKDVATAIIDPKITTNTIKVSDIFQFANNINSDNSTNNNIYAEPEDNDIEFNKNVAMTNSKPNEDGTSYNNYENNDSYKKQKDMSSKPQGIIDSITQELTSVRLQQAIILSEIVGKPKSKTRKRRSF